MVLWNHRENLWESFGMTLFVRSTVCSSVLVSKMKCSATAAAHKSWPPWLCSRNPSPPPRCEAALNQVMWDATFLEWQRQKWTLLGNFHGGHQMRTLRRRTPSAICGFSKETVYWNCCTIGLNPLTTSIIFWFGFPNAFWDPSVLFRDVTLRGPFFNELPWNFKKSILHFISFHGA